MFRFFDYFLFLPLTPALLLHSLYLPTSTWLSFFPLLFFFFVTSPTHIVCVSYSYEPNADQPPFRTLFNHPFLSPKCHLISKHETYICPPPRPSIHKGLNTHTHTHTAREKVFLCYHPHLSECDSGLKRKVILPSPFPILTKVIGTVYNLLIESTKPIKLLCYVGLGNERSSCRKCSRRSD